MKCKTKRDITDTMPDYNVRGTPITRGICPVCGSKVVKMGKTEAHDSIPAPDRKALKREGKLVIVESPAKAKTVGRFLGKGYTVRASVGHVRDLLRSELSIDVENNFQPRYRVPNEKREVVKELKQLAKKAESIYLATDPDREGEAIAWHLMEAAEIKPDISERVVFHEITQPAIEEAFSHPRKINMDLVNAQQTRRLLDRFVGYGISPILWEKVRSRLTAGRVQSVALRLIVNREREIEAFIPKEYWSIEAELQPQGSKSKYITRLVRVDGVEPELPSKEVIDSLVQDMETASYRVDKIKRSERRRKPSGPFITSTLQQEASRKLGYTARRTMALAQQLYEGIDVGEGGATGLITYMRTDSTNIAEVALNEARKYIEEVNGKDFLPDKPVQYRTRAAVAQEAHEAIRPTSVFRTPEKVKPFLAPDMFKVYQIIWQRFIACQMEAAVYNTLSVEVSGKSTDHEYLTRASGSSLKFPGYLIVYEEAKDEDIKSEDNDENIRIPSELEENQPQKLIRILSEQHFTQPLPRYTEASLVQALEEYAIGRPSTYAPILSIIQNRGYVIREQKRLTPTEIGIQVSDLVDEYFSDVINVNFSADMENRLDEIANGQADWVEAVRTFYSRFAPQLEKAKAEMPEQKAELEKIGKTCPKCGKDLVIRWGRYGKFVSCSGFPECRHTEAFLEKIGVTCPKDNGEIVLRKTRRGRVFYGCENYPECDFTSWKQPVRHKCPACSGMLVVSNKREFQCLDCESTFLRGEFNEEESDE